MTTTNESQNSGKGGLLLLALMLSLVFYFIVNSCGQKQVTNLQTPTEYWDSIAKAQSDSVKMDSILKARYDTIHKDSVNVVTDTIKKQ